MLLYVHMHIRELFETSLVNFYDTLWPQFTCLYDAWKVPLLKLLRAKFQPEE